MSTRLRLALAALLVASGAACSGSSFGSGTAAPGGVTPPVNPNQPIQGAQPTVSPQSVSSAIPPSPAPPVTHAFSDAPKTGIPCPESGGYSCTLYFNQPPATPSPSPVPNGKKPKATPTASPTPTPTPSPSPQGSGSASPSPSPTPTGAQMTVALSALPKDAPKMMNPDPKAVSTIPLIALTLKTSDDVLLDGRSTAEFTLPKDEIANRGFAIQFYHQTTSKKHVNNQYVGSYNVSNVKDDKLVFSYTAPKITVKKGDTWLIVLYGDELPKPSPSPGASGSPAVQMPPGVPEPGEGAPAPEASSNP